jgi:hypothetical protein
MLIVILVVDTFLLRAPSRFIDTSRPDSKNIKATQMRGLYADIARCCRQLIRFVPSSSPHQMRLEGGLGVAREVVSGKQALQLVGVGSGGGGEPDADPFALAGEGGEGVVPFTGFCQAFDDCPFVVDRHPCAFERVDELGGFRAGACRHVALRVFVPMRN